MRITSEDPHHPVVDLEPLNLILNHPPLNREDLPLVVAGYDVLLEDEGVLVLQLACPKLGAHNGPLVLAVEEQHLLVVEVVVGADEAGGVSEVDLFVAVVDDDELLVGLLVENELLDEVKDHLAGGLGRAASGLPRFIDKIDPIL